MKFISTYFLLFIMIFISCKDERRNSIIVENQVESKGYSLANDEFRAKILPKIKHDNDKKKLNTLLKVLDQKELSFCNFVKREFEIDDSCYSVALKKYPSLEMQNNFINMHDKIYDTAEKKYLNSLGLTNQEANYLTTVYSFDENVKNFCGKY